ncbi:MAG: alpha/beta fold hydrolase, partial [Nitrospirales bacterium]
MTIVPRLWPRPALPRTIPTAKRLFKVGPDSRLLAYCHWQPKPARHRTIVLVHGLEGCTESHYMLGLAAKGWRAGFNVVRLNQRNCGGSEHLTTTLYNSGMSGDLKAVLEELQVGEGLHAIWFIGYSMGGNLALKMAGEVGSTKPALRGVLAVCPNIDPGACVAALERPGNGWYQRYFLKRL